MKILDDILPEHKRTERLDEHDEQEKEAKELQDLGETGDGGETGNGPAGRKEQYTKSGHTGEIYNS